jgi:hypothetical protein
MSSSSRIQSRTKRPERGRWGVWAPPQAASAVEGFRALADRGKQMPSLRVRVVSVALAASALALAGASSASAAPIPPQRRTPRCTQGVTFRIIAPTVARTRTVTARSANIRRYPGVDCPLITSVERGTRLAGTGAQARVGSSRWLQVRGAFGTAWIAATLVR